MYTMKGRLVVAILLCITLFATTALSRPVVDTTELQKDTASSSGAQVNPDFFWFRPRRHLPWWWFIPPHKPGFAAAPHGAPHNFPKLPWAHSPLPHFPTLKKPHGHSAASAGLEDSRGDDHIEAAAAAAIEKCWSPLAAVDNCVNDILSAFISGTVEFNSACCYAINKMGNECVASFNNQKFTDALSNYCSTH